MRIFKTRDFKKFAKRAGIANEKLVQAVHDAEAGLIDADYGSGVIKQRIARPNQGKSGGYRSIILFRKGDKAFFVFGFAKNQWDNIDMHEERYFKDLAKITLSLNDEQITTLIEDDKLEEVLTDD